MSKELLNLNLKKEKLRNNNLLKEKNHYDIIIIFDITLTVMRISTENNKNKTIHKIYVWMCYLRKNKIKNKIFA